MHQYEAYRLDAIGRTGNEFRVDSLTKTLDVRCVDQEFTAIAHQYSLTIATSGWHTCSIPTRAVMILEHATLGLCRGEVREYEPALTSISVRSCQRFIATTHRSSLLRQLSSIQCQLELVGREEMERT